MVERTVTNDRGLGDYGSPVCCSYGSEISVRDSSAYGDGSYWPNHCWLRIDDTSWREEFGGKKYASSHLSIEQAEEVIEQLQAWVDVAKAARDSE